MQAHLFLPKSALAKSKGVVWQSTYFIRTSRESSSKETAWEGLCRVEVKKRNCLSSHVTKERDKKGRREESGKEEREKKWMPIKREEVWEKEILALRYDSCRSQWMHFLYGSVPSVCTQLVDCKPRESANRKLSLPLQRSKALWTAGILYTQITYCVIHKVFELFRNTEANYSWHVLLSYYSNRHPSHVELCHIKCTKS